MLLLWMGSVYVALFFYACGIHIRQHRFYQLHELFDKLAEEVGAYVDLLIERVTTLTGSLYSGRAHIRE